MLDLIGVFRDFKYIASGKILKNRWLEETSSGQHRLEGILVMTGEEIRRGVEIPACEIIDLAPTILHILGLAVPSDMDGCVLEGAFSSSFLEEYPVQFSEAQANDTNKKTLDVGPDQEDKQEIIDFLKGLGYLD